MQKSFSFKHSTGQDVYEITLKNVRGTEVKITNLGAILMSYKVMTPKGYNDIVLGFDSAEAYTQPAYLQSYPYFGAAIGRYGNRIKNAAFQIDGIEYKVTANMSPHQLHGGFEGFDKKVWDIVEQADADRQSVTLQYTSPDGEEGFPGTLSVTLRFLLEEDDALTYEFTAITDKPTALNLTHHSYFNLNNGDGTILDHHVTIDADYWMEQDGDFVVTGVQIPVAGTRSHNFSTAKAVAADWNKEAGYDQCFILNHTGFEIPQATVFSPKSNMQLEIYSNEPCMQFYTAKWCPVVKGKNEVQYGPFSALCLETHKAPNSVNLDDYPSTILRPGEVYTSKTVYKPSFKL